MNKIRIAIVLIVLLVFGIALTVSGISNIIKLNGEIPDFNYDSMQNIKKGDFVQGYVGYILDCYANETTTNTTMGIETSSRTSEEYFIMPLINEADAEKDLYITITASKSADRDLLYQICDETYESYNNDDIDWTEFGIVAKVKNIDPELTQYMTEWFQETAWFDEDENNKTSVSEIRQHILPYELVIYNTSGAYIGLIAGIIIIAAFAVAGVIAYRKLKPQPLYGGTESYSPYEPNTATPAQPADGGFSEVYTPPAPQPIPDIPQPLQPDEFFARTPKAPKPAEEKAETPKPSSDSAEAPAILPSAAGDMDALDTSALNTDGLEYYDDAETAEEAEYEFDNDIDFGDVSADSIDISE